jgi:hypothetical protein
MSFWSKLLQLYDKYDQNLLELHGDEFLIKTIATLRGFAFIF